MRFLVPLLILVLPIPARAGPWKVVGGAPVEDGSWPDAVALFSGDNFGCTGVLVAPDVVLTAAHCDFALSYAIVGPRDFETDGEKIDVLRTESHPNSWVTYDVAVVVLEHAAAAAPRMLALDCIADDWLVDGADVAIVGYGATDEFATEWTTLLHEARATASDADCSNLNEGCQEAISPGGELIAGGAGVDSCNGDSGGPLYLLTSEGDFLVGTTSRATDTGNVPCGDGGIYVRADAIADWIEEETGRVLPRPDCSDRNEPPAPTYEPAEVVMGQQVEVVVHANDPDPQDHHVWRLVAPPAFGHAIVPLDGEIVFVTDYTATGTARFVVEVIDDGGPPYSAQMIIDVEVLPDPIPPKDCGCNSGPSAGAAAFLPLAALLRRRRARRASGDL